MLEAQIALVEEPWFHALLKSSPESSPLFLTYKALCEHVKRLGNTGKAIKAVVKNINAHRNFLTRGFSYDSHKKALKEKIETLRHEMTTANGLSISALT